MPVRSPHAWMWSEAVELLEQAERLHRQYFRFACTASQQRRWEPPVDIVESARDLRISVALPGVSVERIQLRADSGVLLIEATRPAPTRVNDVAVHRLEIPYGRFERRVALPPGRYELAEQAYSNGCLELVLIKH